MKTGRILIVMIFAALGLTAHAQRGAYANNGNFNSVRQYIQVLDLTPSQVRAWSELNNYYESEFIYVRNDRGLSARAKSRKLDRLFNQRDRDLRGILSNRQYRTFSNLKSYNAYSRPSAYYGSTVRYNNNRYSNNRYNNNRRGRGNTCYTRY